MPKSNFMTIGQLSERTGVSVKQLRRYEDLGYIYTVGRSAANYRLFDESALWCVEMVTRLRSVGMTLAQITEITDAYLDEQGLNIGPLIAEKLAETRQKVATQIEELEGLLDRIDRFEVENRPRLVGDVDIRDTDPRFCSDHP